MLFHRRSMLQLSKGNVLCHLTQVYVAPPLGAQCGSRTQEPIRYDFASPHELCKAKFLSWMCQATNERILEGMRWGKNHQSSIPVGALCHCHLRVWWPGARLLWPFYVAFPVSDLCNHGWFAH